MRDRRDGAAETEPVAGRDVALGDRDEAREPRLGGKQIVAARVERTLRHPIADREQLAVGIEQEAETHCERHRPRGRFEGSEARRQRSGGVRRLIDVTPVTLDRAACRLHPEQHVRAGAIAPFARECGGDVGHGLGLRGEVRQALGDALTRQFRLPHGGGKRGERGVELVPGHGLRSPAGAHVVRRFTREVERVRDAGQALRRASASGRSIPGRRWRARSGGRPGFRCRPWKHIAGPAGADRSCRTS